MRNRIVVLLLAAFVSACGESAAEKAVAAVLPDPRSARFQHVRDRDGHVCGEVNHRDENGAYARYSRFVYDKRAREALIDPGISDQPASAGPWRQACGKPFGYQTVGERLTCAEQPKIEAAVRRQNRFDSLWRRVCG